jgi:hypothetical protein
MFEDTCQSLLNMCLLGCLFFDPHLPRHESNPQICDRENKSNNARTLWTLKSLPLYCWHRVLFGDVFIRGVVLLHSDNLKLAGITWDLCRHVSSRVGVKFVVGALLLSVRTIQCFTIEFLIAFFINMEIDSSLHFTDPSWSFCSLATVFLLVSLWVSTLISCSGMRVSLGYFS